MQLETNEKIIQITQAEKGFFALTNTGQVYQITKTDDEFNHVLITSNSKNQESKNFNVKELGNV